MIDIIYCADNRKYGEVARDYVNLGVQLPNTFHFADLTFADQNWRNPDRDKYLGVVRKYKPKIATVLDWERWGQLPDVLGWAEDVAAHVDVVVIIPKVQGGIACLPRRIGGKEVRLGYSVPTSYAGTDVLLIEFQGWPVHLLGGSFRRQIELTYYLDVRSADHNCTHHKIKVGQFFDGRRWRQLRSAGYDVVGADIPEMVLRLSLPNFVKAMNR